MATPSRDTIQRSYLRRHLQRKLKQPNVDTRTARSVLVELLDWIGKQTARSRKPGGLGRA